MLADVIADPLVKTMTMTIKNRAISDFGFYIIVIVIAALAWESQNYMTVQSQRIQQKQSKDGIVGEALTKLNDVQQRQLDAYLELNRLLTTFGTTILGALGFVLFDRERARTWTQHRWAASVGVLCVIVSIFFGYVAYLFILSMLRDGSFNITSSNTHLAQQAHFYSFLAGVIFLADFMYYNLIEEGKHANRNAVAGT
jgi:hypothetical protein